LPTVLIDSSGGVDQGSAGLHYQGLFVGTGGALCALVSLVAYGVSLGVRDAAQRAEAVRR
jgi:hypothetical protein